MFLYQEFLLWSIHRFVASVTLMVSLGLWYAPVACCVGECPLSDGCLALALSPVLLPQCSMPACVTAFHVTCAFDHNLDMRTILADNDEVKFKSFCLEHSTGATKLPEEARTEPDQAQLDLEKVTLRKQKLQQLEEDFYELVKPSEVAENLDLSESLVDFVYQYWKLKRKANSNKPLLTPKTDEVDNLAQQEQDVLYRRLKLFMHLRQDLERVSTASPSVVYLCDPSGLL